MRANAEKAVLCLLIDSAATNREGGRGGAYRSSPGTDPRPLTPDPVTGPAISVRSDGGDRRPGEAAAAHAAAGGTHRPRGPGGGAGPGPPGSGGGSPWAPPDPRTGRWPPGGSRTPPPRVQTGSQEQQHHRQPAAAREPGAEIRPQRPVGVRRRRPRLRAGPERLRPLPQPAVPPPPPRLRPRAPAAAGPELRAAAAAAAGRREGPPPGAEGAGEGLHPGRLHPPAGLEPRGGRPVPGDLQSLRAEAPRPADGARGAGLPVPDDRVPDRRQVGEQDGRARAPHRFWVAGGHGGRVPGGAGPLPRRGPPKGQAPLRRPARALPQDPQMSRAPPRDPRFRNKCSLWVGGGARQAGDPPSPRPLPLAFLLLLLPRGRFAGGHLAVPGGARPPLPPPLAGGRRRGLLRPHLLLPLGRRRGGRGVGPRDPGRGAEAFGDGEAAAEGGGAGQGAGGGGGGQEQRGPPGSVPPPRTPPQPVEPPLGPGGLQLPPAAVQRHRAALEPLSAGAPVPAPSIPAGQLVRSGRRAGCEEKPRLLPALKWAWAERCRPAAAFKGCGPPPPPPRVTQRSGIGRRGRARATGTRTPPAPGPPPRCTPQLADRPPPSPAQMASERLRGAQDLLDLTFQSLATQHMDLKQVELDTAVAKVDELSRQLESLWTDGPGPPKEPYGRSRSPLARRSLAAESAEVSGDPLGRPASPRAPPYLPGGGEERAPSPRPKVLPVPYEGPAPPPGAGGRAPSPRPHRPYEFLGLGGSPRPGEGSAFFPDRAPSPRPPVPPPYEAHGLYPTLSGAPVAFRAQDDLLLKRRPPRGWNESDLDLGYEKRPPGAGGYERSGEGLRASPGPPPAPWRESSLDGTGAQSRDGVFGGHSATLPRNYKVSPLAGERRAEGAFRRPAPGAPPRAWHLAQQPVSRIPVPPPGGRPRRHKPLPLSMIFKLQNAFWEQGAGGPRGLPPILSPPPGPRAPQKQPQLPALPPAPPTLPAGEVSVQPAPPEPPEPPAPEAEPELERLLQGAEAEGLQRPLSPTRLQPLLPPEAQRVPEFEEVARVLAEMPRPLKRRGSMEQCPGPALPPTRTRQYQQLITRLLHRPPRRDEPPAPGDAGAPPELPPPAPLAPEARPACHSPPPPSPSSPAPAPERRSALRDPSSPRRRPGARVRLNPLVLLLDAALTGELDVVQQAVAELNDPSQPNDEGITALHNAICGANYAIVDFLIASGANVNSPDSHGWTPLHCAASCNDTRVCVALVRHGAAIFASTASDGSLAVEKCDPYREGYADCASYLTEVEQGMGVLNSGVVYALWDYSAEFGDELSFREGEPVTVLRRQPPEELEWWWGSLYGHEGYVPRNYFGLFPRVRPQRKKS